MSEPNIDFQDIVNEVSQDPWGKLLIERAVYKVTNIALTTQNQELEKRIGELTKDDKSDTVQS